MPPTEFPLEIPRSRGKLALLVLGSATFVALCGWMLSLDGSKISALHQVVAFIGVAFFGLALLHSLRALFDPRPGLVIRKDGFEDRSSPVAVGFVPWNEVTAIEIYKISVRGASERVLVVKVREPAPYAARGGALARLARRENLRMVGSPITLNSKSLRCSLDELARIFEQCWHAALASAARQTGEPQGGPDGQLAQQDQPAGHATDASAPVE